MAAFVTFVRANAVWIYLFLFLGILFSIKMLVDAQQLSRNTLFSLDQERATEQTYQGLGLVVLFLLAILIVTMIVVVVAPLVPPQEPPILRGPTSTLFAIVFPSSTPMATATPTFPPPTETPFVSSTPMLATATRSIKPATSSSPPAATPVYLLPKPSILGPLPNGGAWTGEGQANAAITFKWTCELCSLGPTDWYEVVISYVDKTGVTRSIAGRTQGTFLSLRRIIDGGPFYIYQQAKEDTFSWVVQVKREPGNQAISPPSDSWKFIWH